MNNKKKEFLARQVYTTENDIEDQNEANKEQTNDYEESKVIFENYKVKINAPVLSIKKAPKSHELEKTIGLFMDDIVEITEEQDGFGKLESEGWIDLNYTTRL